VCSKTYVWLLQWKLDIEDILATLESLSRSWSLCHRL